MIKEWFGGLMKRAIRAHTDQYEFGGPGRDIGPTPVGNMDALIHDLPMAMIVHPISNGYIIRVEQPGNQWPAGEVRRPPVLIYAADSKDVSDQIVAHQARHVLDGGRGDSYAKSSINQASLQRKI